MSEIVIANPFDRKPPQRDEWWEYVALALLSGLSLLPLAVMLRSGLRWAFGG